MSPELTGGAGFTYEAGVAATYLASLLVEGDIRGLRSTTIERVLLQRAQLGEPLDDIIIHGIQRNGLPAKLALQVKSNITLSAADTAFKEIVVQCWKTIAGGSFREGTDRVGLAVSQVAIKAYRDMRTITEWARVSVDFEDFKLRVKKVGSLSKQGLVDAFQANLSVALEREPSDHELWTLIRHFVLVRFEVLGEAAQDAYNSTTQLKTILPHNETQRASELWTALTSLADNAAGAAGSFDRINIREAIAPEFSFDAAKTIKSDLEKLSIEVRLAADEIRNSIDGHIIDRSKMLNLLQVELEKSRLVQITGRPGSGKSVLLRRLAEEQEDEGPLLFLKSNRLMSGGWAGYAERHQLSTTSPETVLRELGATHQPILFVDGLDRIQTDHQPAVRDIIGTLIANEEFKNWKIVATVRDGLSEHLDTWLPPELRKEKLATVEVGPLDDKEAKGVGDLMPELKSLLFGDGGLKEISRRPFFLQILSNLSSDGSSKLKTEVDLAEIWWRESGYSTTSILKRKRQDMLLGLAKAGAQKFGRDIPISGFDAEAVAGLIDDQIIMPKLEGHTVDFVHDIFFEWSFLQLLLAENVAGRDWVAAVVESGQPPALERCVTLYSQYCFEREVEWENRFDALTKEEIRTGWPRAWILAPLSSPLFISKNVPFTNWLLADDSSRLRKLLNWFQATKTEVNRRILENPELSEFRDELAYHHSWPADLISWRVVCSWLISCKARIPRHFRPDVLTVFEIWQNAVSSIDNPVSQTIVSISLEWLIEYEDYEEIDWRKKGLDKERYSELSYEDQKSLAARLRSNIFACSATYPDTSKSYLERLMKNDQVRSNAMETLLASSDFLAKSMPKKLAALFLKDLLRELPKAHQSRMLKEDRERREHAASHPEGSRERQLLIPSIGYGGVDHHDWEELSVGRYLQRFYPASPLHQPFKALFEHSPDIAIETVRTIANHAINAWLELHEIDAGNKRSPIPEVLTFPWGKEKFWGGFKEYGAYRGVLAPNALESALMAMELWAFDQIAKGRTTDDVLAKILPGQQHIAVLGLATALVIGTHTITHSSLPIICCQRLWHWEIRRIVEIDRPNMYANLFGVDNITHAKEIQRLNGLGHRQEEMRQMAMLVAFCDNEELIKEFQIRLNKFPEELPFQYKDELDSDEIIVELKERAERFKRLAYQENYCVESQDDGIVQISPKISAEDRPQLEKTIEQQNRFGQSFTLYRWAEAKLKNETSDISLSFDDAVAAAKLIANDLEENPPDAQDIIDYRSIAVFSVAASTLFCEDSNDQEQIEWARKQLHGVRSAPIEPNGTILPSQLYLNDPIKILPYALVGLARRGFDETDAVSSLFTCMTIGKTEVQEAAVKACGSTLASAPRLFWHSFAMRLDLAIRNDATDHHSARSEMNVKLRSERIEEVIENATRRYSSDEFKLPELPDPWVFSPLRDTGNSELDAERRKRYFWRNPNIWLDVDDLEKLFDGLPLPAVLDSTYRDNLLTLCEQLLDWTISKFSAQEDDHEPERLSRDLWDWQWCYPGFLGRLSSFLSADEISNRFLNRILSAPEKPGLELLQHFVSAFSCMSILDSNQVDREFIPLLVQVASKLEPDSWDKSRQQLSNERFSIMKSLKFTAVENAGGAKRFANSDFSEIELVIPVIDAVIAACGMVTPAAGQWLSLMERSKENYPTDDFVRQAKTLLKMKSYAGWRNTRLPGRLSAILRYHAEREKLTTERQLGMLEILDALIDEGDRRSAALQKSELFRSALKV